MCRISQICLTPETFDHFFIEMLVLLLISKYSLYIKHINSLSYFATIFLHLTLHIHLLFSS